MPRTILALLLVGAGAVYAARGPFQGLLVYLGNAYFRPEQWASTGLIRSLHISFIAGCYVLLATLLSRKRWILNRRLALVLLFVVQTSISVILSEHAQSCWPYWLHLCKVLIIVYLMVVLVDDAASLRSVFLVMGLALGVRGAEHGWAYWAFTPDTRNLDEIPFLGCNNGVAAGMLMLVPILLVLAQTTRRTWARVSFWFLVVGVLYRAISAHSRSAFLACLALGGTHWLLSQQKARTLIGMAIVVLIVLPKLPDVYWDRIDTIRTSVVALFVPKAPQAIENNSAPEPRAAIDESSLGRLHFWRVALDMTRENPVFGVGFGGFQASYDAYDFSNGRFGRKRAVHSVFFGVLAELGCLGAILYGLILFDALRSCRRVRKLAARAPAISLLGLCARALETSLIVFLVGGGFINTQYSEMFWHLIGLTIVVERLAVRDAHAEPQEAARAT